MKYTCGNCGKKGHNARGCSKKAKKQKASSNKRSSKVVRRGTSVTRTRLGRQFSGARGWLTLYHGGRSGATQHDKTWAIKLEKAGGGYRVVTRWGRRTGEKNETRHPVTSLQAAVNKANRLLNSKYRKGYRTIGINRHR